MANRDNGNDREVYNVNIEETGAKWDNIFKIKKKLIFIKKFLATVCRK